MWLNLTWFNLIWLYDLDLIWSDLIWLYDLDLTWFDFMIWSDRIDADVILGQDDKIIVIYSCIRFDRTWAEMIQQNITRHCSSTVYFGIVLNLLINNKCFVAVIVADIRLSFIWALLFAHTQISTWFDFSSFLQYDDRCILYRTIKRAVIS